MRIRNLKFKIGSSIVLILGVIILVYGTLVLSEFEWRSIRDAFSRVRTPSLSIEEAERHFEMLGN